MPLQDDLVTGASYYHVKGNYYPLILILARAPVGNVESSILITAIAQLQMPIGRRDRAELSAS